MPDSKDPLIVGQISGVYGVSGWLKINSYTRPEENIFTYAPWLILKDDTWQAYDIEAAQRRHGRLLVKLSGIDTPEQGRTYRRCALAIKTEQLAPLAAGEYYWHQLIGLEVFNRQQQSLGTITEILETGANDVLVVGESEQHKTRTLIPLVMGVYVKQIDLQARTMQVDWQAEV